MEELYRAIEEKIAASGYQKKVDGKEFYNEICDEMDGKENGSYVILLKQDGDVCFECKIKIMDEDFDLPCMDIHDGGHVYHVDFDN